jgi:aldehyde:ferredoxin oxidoreductase
MVLERKVAFINLTDDSIEIKPVPLYLRKKFLGGRGINMHFLSQSFPAAQFEGLCVVEEIAYHCDLCGGDLQCIKVCTPKAISIAR